MKPIKLTWKQVRANCVKYLKRGKLQCQLDHPAYCSYGSDHGIRCAIGASFTTTQINKIKELHLNESRIAKLQQKNVIKAHPKTMIKLRWLQSAHDTGIDALTDFLKNNK